MSKTIKLTLLTKPGCHLCEVALTAVNSVVSAVKAQSSVVVQIELEELNILEDEILQVRYAEEIPVLQINDETHAYWSIDPKRLRAKLEELLTT